MVWNCGGLGGGEKTPEMTLEMSQTTLPSSVLLLLLCREIQDGKKKMEMKLCCQSSQSL